jgi:hypothetical protein
MRKNPEHVAWAVTLLAFAIFCLILVAVPLGIRWYILHAETEHEALVESLVGTIVLEPPVGTGPTPLSKGESRVVTEGTIIRVDETSEATITFFDNSFARLFSGTTLRVDRLRGPRYRSSPLPSSIRLYVLGGRLRIGTALSLDTPLDFGLATLHGEALLDADGTYTIDVTNNGTDISAYRGQAHVMAQDVSVTLDPAQRTQITLDQAPQPAMGLARNLLVNGELNEPLETGWRVYNDQGADGGEVDGTANVVVDEGRRAVRYLRVGGQGNHCETVLEQVLDQQLPDPLSSLVVRATVKVRYQSLSGGGYLSSEYPLMIRLTYRDVYDSEAEWVQGFYYENPSDNPATYGLQIPQDRWYFYDSGNLLDSLPIRPYKLVRLRVYASGWDYDSLLSDINLVVE